MPKSLSRTSSASSVSTDDSMASNNSNSVFVDGLARRTRKRFTQDQLSLLEGLYYQVQHPTRAQRDEVARKGGMETKSVTIWFQNKRQTRRKEAMAISSTDPQTPNDTPSTTPKADAQIPHEFMAGQSLDTLEPSPPSESSFYTSGTPSSPSTTSSSLVSSSFSSRYSSSGITSSSSHHTRRLIRSDQLSRRPSLDRVASRSELRPSLPSTPPRGAGRRGHGDDGDSDDDGEKPIWKLMASSPLAPNNSPLARDLVEFGTKHTLEWACAKNRLRRKDNPHEDDEERIGEAMVLERTSPLGRRTHSGKHPDHFAGEATAHLASSVGGESETEDEEMEAVTPSGSLDLLTGEEVMSTSLSRQLGTAFRPFRSSSSPSASSPPAKKEVASMLPPPPRSRPSLPPSIVVQDDATMDAALILCGLPMMGSRFADSRGATPASTATTS